MQVAVWIIVILLIIFLFRLFRRWIKRLIFILILLTLAFFIYGIFSPSGAARLRYNVRTFPQRMASRMTPGSEFLDYNTYKSKISSIGDNIGDAIGDKIDLNIDDKNENTDLDDNTDIGIDEKHEGGVKDTEKYTENYKNDDTSESTDKQTIKAFPKSVDFIDIPNIKKGTKEEDKSENYGPLTGYSKSDLLGIINKYIETNLDKDTDILVTVEYEDGNSNPQKIILQTQHKASNPKHSVAITGNSMNNLFNENGDNLESDTNSLDETKTVETEYINPKTTPNKLSQKEQEEAEKIFSILF